MGPHITPLGGEWNQLKRLSFKEQRLIPSAQFYYCYVCSRLYYLHRARAGGLGGIEPEEAPQAGEQDGQELGGVLEEQAEAQLHRSVRRRPGHEAGCREPQEREEDEQDSGFLKGSFPHSGLLRGQLALGK